ncbi:HlyD family efflux transporter periplasmic adaptor subunit [Aliigemmobacter aestuarii]|uniref:HlyD family efflux transporter periplasmic adaptor subunit n=1 Tax=Aliigemmobacter aestuarii TaxID=1445661 RepID=A0A4S3MST4_9RHOB|nr:HlyD family efflux transporter periplasmic adaptor subunit [Gemmobacter aestuarii]THD85639.1 HlyD family efflux transporter periplasmic adaptor subunit [Gemmobacter aestuarii]
MTVILDDGFENRMQRPSLTVWMIVVAVAVFLLWSAFAWVSEIVRASGQVVSSSRPQIISNLEGGILAELDVSEGDVVEPGQVLGRLHGTQYQSAARDLADQVAALEIRRLRLEAEMAGRDRFEVPGDLAARVPEIAASEAALLQARQGDFRGRLDGAAAVLEQAATELQLLEKMHQRELAPLIEVTRARKSHSDAQNRYSDTQTEMELQQAGEYSETLTELTSLRQKLTIAEDQLRRTTLVAPMKGVVNKLSVTTIGGVVRPGEEILQIIPLEDELFIEARVKPEDIASVRHDQDATIKLSAYDYTIYGTLKGKVHFISADTFRDERSRNPDGDPHYRVTVKVDMTQLTDRQTRLEIRPGMLAEVELQTGGKTILSYLTKPLYKSREALRER